MKLAEAIFNLNGLPDEAVLFAERINGHFTPESPVAILSLDEKELEMPTSEVAALKAPGLEYFLEAFLIRDMVEDWQNTRTTGSLDAAQLIKRIIHYAEFDA